MVLWVVQNLKRKLQSQNKVLRFILDLSLMHSVNSTVFETLNMLNVDRRLKQMRLNHVLILYIIQPLVTIVSLSEFYKDKSAL